VDSAHASATAASLDQATIDSLSAHVAILDDAGTILAVNAAWKLFGATNGGGEGDGVGANYFQVCDRAVDDDPRSRASEIADGLRDTLAGVRDEYVVEYPCDSPSERRQFVLRATRFAGEGSTRVVLQHQNVTVHRAAEEAVLLRGQLLDTVDAAVIALDTDGLVTAWNRGAELMYGYRSDEALGRVAARLIVPEASLAFTPDAMSDLRAEGRWEGELVLQRKDGTQFPAYVRNATLETVGGGVTGYVGVSIDMTERLRAERDLRSTRDYLRAVTDSMGDGLCTLDDRGRIVFLNARAEELLGWTTAELAGQGLHEALHHLGPDGSPVAAEDCPLVEARGNRSVARIEDDVLVRRDGTLLPVRQVQTPLETDDSSGGFVLVFSDITGRKRQERDAERRLRDLSWIERIRQALDEDRFVLHAQPIVEIGTGRIVQHELLIRMLDEEGSTFAPGLFLPVAETYGLIGEIDRWVVRQSIALAAEGDAVELNVSAHSLSDPTFYHYVDAELRRSGADPTLLVFELTETALMRDEEAALRWIAAISKRGCGLALDDFGTGYGGFSYLKRLPVDYLKIDIEFVRDLTSDPASRQVVEAVVGLARGFGIKTVAEGVEDDETLALLRELGVDYAQGYGIGGPAPLSETIKAGEPCRT